MTDAKADILLHPARLRILMAVSGRQMTPQQIAAVLPDIAQATLYRHINRLCAAGILTVVEESRVRGTVEKVYTVSEAAATLSEAEFAQASHEDHLRYFTAFTASLLSQFRLYLRQEHLDLKADGVGYRTAALYLTDAEFEEVREALRRALKPYLSNTPGPGRRRRLLSTVAIPDPRAEQG
jgi:DNA-binding transcriptional ArsR family regulator